MSQFISGITDTPDWETWVLNLGFAKEKKAELLQRSNPKFSAWMVDYCIAELRREAHRTAKKDGMIVAFNGNVVKSNMAVPENLREDFSNVVASLTDTPKYKKDWLPGSNKTTLAVIDPSLYPLTYGVTRVLGDKMVDCASCISQCGKGNIMQDRAEICPNPVGGGSVWYEKGIHNSKFQWLPCDVDIHKEPKIVSYINNLHPQEHPQLYVHLEEILARLIPLWNSALTPLRYQNFRRWKGPFDPEAAFAYEIEEEKEEDAVNIQLEYAETGIQVIIDIHEVHLTPESPEYAGGNWQASGRMNEHICSTALYYFDDENVTPGHIAFRQPVDPYKFAGEAFGDDDYKWLRVYGLREGQPAVQEIGSVETREGRVVAFSNILQHRMQPFRLADPTKPGHRKVLTVHLVDPNLKITSTSSVPCQQRDWWAKAVNATRILKRFPVELRDKIFFEVESPIGLEEARRLRLEFLEDIEEYRQKYQVENFEREDIQLQEF